MRIDSREPAANLGGGRAVGRAGLVEGFTLESGQWQDGRPSAPW